MSDCKRLEELVTPFVDGELPEAECGTVETHLRVCAPCHSRVVAERAVRDLIRQGKAVFDEARAPDSLRAACTSLARPRKGPITSFGVSPRSAVRRPSWRARLTSIALAASLVLVVAGAFLYQFTEKSARIMAAQLAADHVKCFAMNRVLGTHQPSSLVERSMLAGFGWQMHLPFHPERAGLELVGARPCLYAEGKVAHIMYKHHGRPVSLFMLPNASRPPEFLDVLGHEVAIWCVGQRTFVLVAREPRHEVERMASFVRAGLQ
jgi:anti-sigma factor RsiW